MQLGGFFGGFTDGTYGYAVPHKTGFYFGKVCRFALNSFGSVTVLDLTLTNANLVGKSLDLVDKNKHLVDKMRIW